MMRTVPPCSECTSRADSVFCRLASEGLHAANEAKTYSFYKKGQEIYAEGSTAYGVYCVFSGMIKLHRTYLGEEQITGFQRKGSLLGYRAVLSGGTFTETATAVEDAVVCFFPAASYGSLVANDPQFAEENFRLLASTLGSTERKLRVASGGRAQARLATLLIMLFRFYKKDGDRALINLRLKRAEMAYMCGLTKETTSRILSALQKVGIIGLQGWSISILDEERLKEVAEDQAGTPVLYHIVK